MKSFKSYYQLVTYLFLTTLLTVASSITTQPTFVTSIASTFETGTLQIGVFSTTTSGSFSYLSQTLTFLNSYSNTPSVAYGLAYLNSNWVSTTSTIQTIIDLSLASTTASSATFQLNFTSSTVLNYNINYIACVNSGLFFLDVRNSYNDLSSNSAILASNVNSARSTSLSLTYRSKSNSSNAIVIYNTVGLSMIRSSNTFDFRLATVAYLTSSVSLSLTLQSYNGMRFIRISMVNYESVTTTIDSPYFLDMGSLTILGGTIPDSSNLGLTVLGNIFTGMTDWTLSDSNAVLNYNMTLNGLIYTISSNTVTRSQTAYLWYRVSTCPTYYFNQSNTCVSCDYTCLTCSYTTNTSCLTCASNSYRTYLSSNQSCPCNTNYKDVGVSICQAIACDYTICSACSADNVCSSCVTGTKRIISNNTCVCQPYTVYVSSPNCQPCWPTCYACTSPFNANGCTSCSSSRDHRTFIAASSTCACMNGYYQNPSLASIIYQYLEIGIPCLQCQYTCATCTVGTACLTCNASLNRVLNVSSNFCSCNSGFYDNGVQSCSSCPYYCFTCSSATICLSCSSTRTLTSNNCPCNSGYYDVGVSTCQSCQYSCYTCTNSSTCTSCNIAYFRTMVNGTCSCITGYFDVNGVQVCSTCDSTCYSCTGAASNACTSCDPTKMRQLASNNSCVCQTGYYQTSSLGILTCTSCYYSCGSCSASPACTSCNASNYRILFNTSCICLDKYYDDGGNKLCKSCPYYCLTCSSSAACLTCDSTTRNISNLTTCPCNQGYYDDGISSSCLPCLSSCLTCSNPNNCTVCASGRTLTSLLSCVCSTRTYEPYCNTCFYSCLSCLGSSNVCTTCNGTAMRYLNSTSFSCLCYTGYYDNGSNQLCGTCQYSCLTCSSSTSCLTCPTNRVLNGSYCSCVSSYYQNSGNLNCLPCHYSCTTCSSYSVCSSCNSTNYRTTNANTTLCICSTGYYDNGVNQLCYACSSICLTCSSYSVCTSCSASLHFYYNNGTCVCTTLYYLDSASQSCLACDYSCASCTNSSACLNCQPNRTLIVGSTCSCITGTFNNPSTHNCDSCSYPCITCTSSSSTCTSCDSNSNRTLNSVSNSCVCVGSTYDSGLACLSCLATCQTCSNSTACITCLTGSLRILDINNLCVCPTAYHDQNGTLLTCKVCNYTCATCINSQSCLTCYTGRIPSVGGFCYCPANYYYDNGVNGQCISCAYNCLSCSVISTNCTSCLSSTFRSLTNNSCICQQGFYDTGIAQCQTCQYSCLKCSSASSCSSCNSTNQRVYQSGPYCSCLNGYYDISNQQLCASCNYTCLTCISSSTICLTCPTTRTFDKISSCPCNSGYYDAGSATCNLCAYYCLTCSAAITCINCPSSTRQLNTSSQCSCLNGYYDANSLNCLACSPLCYSCSNYQTCTACDTTTFRQLVSTSCICPSTYFDASSSGNYICQKCSYSCATCISLTRCTSCDINNYRIYNLNTTLCSCSNGYYDNGVDASCIPCCYDCLTCSSGTVCLTCPSNRYLTANNTCACNTNLYTNGTLCQSCPVECSSCLNSAQCTACNGIRTLSSYSCVCPGGYYAITGSYQCSPCLYSCLTCVTGSQCSTCNSTNKRYLSGSSCLCLNYYYDDFVNQACQPCQYSCLTCSQNSSCLTCDSSIHRVPNPNTTLCDCIPGYYQDATLTCLQCPYNCLTCSSSTVCLTCNPTYSRVLNTTTNQCDCPTIGYYDTMISQVCATCDYTCYSCSSSSTYCTSCLNTTYRTLSVSSCVCSNGYFGVVNLAICQSCSYVCVTCSVLSTNCTLCSLSNYRSTTPNCACLDGYYDDGSNSMCGACNYVCQTCSNGLTCTTCNLTSSFRSLNNITLMCDCITQYYDSGTTICLSCYYTCLTCEKASQCLTCPATRSLSLTSCVCLQQYYDDGVSLNCQPCQYSCQTCLNSNSCFSCNSLNFRTYNSSTLLCSCLTGYYDTNISRCQKCDVSCYTCISASSCSSCPASINKTINATSGSSLCICLYGYYENKTAGALLGYNSVCNPCYYACQTCSSQSTYCTLCNSSSFRTLTSSHQCQCMTSYFQVSGQQQCLPCYTNCLSCYGTLSNNCLTCNNLTYYLSNTCYVTCPAYYTNPTNTSIRVCLSCPTNCLSCPQSTSTCAVCVNTYFIFSYNSSYSVCIQNCPDLYYQINQTCYKCISPCVKCTAAFTCTSCPNYYYLTSGYCYPCQSSCLTCSGSTALDCLTCMPNYILKNKVCQKLACSSTQYVQSSTGCVQCLSTFPNTLTCLSTGPTTCNDGYILSNNSCLSCSQVAGYTYDSTTGKCKDYCGDGIRITDLCDDGNNLNGDGCSSICTIQSGWSCPLNLCTLTQTPILTLISLNNYPTSHSLSLVLGLSIGLRLVEGNFILQFTKISKFNFSLTSMNIYYTQYKLIITYFQSPANNKLSLSIRSPISSRLLVTSSLQLSISLNLSLSVPIVTSPPAIYFSDTQTNIFSEYLLGLIASLHILILLSVVIALWMKLKVMLLIIDALNSITVLYILAGLGAYSISLVSFDSMRALQPFIHQFGTSLSDISTNFYYFNYSQTFFSSCLLQAVVIGFCIAMCFIKPFLNTHDSQQNIWLYLKTGFVFAFAYDLLLSCFCTFFLTNHNSYENSYSWAFAFLTIIYLFYEALFYLLKMKSLALQKKIVPGVSFMTNELENKEKVKTEINIFEFEDELTKQKKLQEHAASSSEDGRTEGLARQNTSQLNRTLISYYDLAPSAQTQYSMSHSNHIKHIYLPISSILLAALYSIIVNIQTNILRASLLFVLSLLYLIFVFFSRNESLRSIRIIKLLLFAIIYLMLSIVVLITAALSQSIDLKSIDIVIVSIVCLALLVNLITFIINIRYSQAYREYLVIKNNEKIIERNKRLNETRQKLYYKNQPAYLQSKKPDSSSIQPASLDIVGQNDPQIQISEQPAQEKDLKFSQIRNKHVESRTFLDRDKDNSQILQMRIDDEISDIREEKVTSNRVLSEQKSPLEVRQKTAARKSKSPDRSRQANRIKGASATQMSLVSKKDTPSLLIDNTLERIQQFETKQSQKEDVSPAKKMRRRKKINREVDLIDSDQEKIQSRQDLRKPHSKLQEEEDKTHSAQIEDILDEMQMPRGFKQEIKRDSSKQMHIQKMHSIDDVSSIREERELFAEQALAEQNPIEMSVFNKILQDYTIYKNKKINHKKLKQLKLKTKD